MDPADAHVENVRKSVARGEASRSIHAASWQRCISVYGLDPAQPRPPIILDAAELGISREKSAAILEIGAPTVHRLRLVAGSGVCILWADADGIPLKSWSEEADRSDLDRLGLCPGVDWSERKEGTNGIGTCLIEKRPLVVRKDQHFFPRDTGITCLVAPIFDHEGILRGALNATVYGRHEAAGKSELLFAAICDAAQEIETEYFHHAFDGQQILSLGGRRGGALLAVDRDQMLVGATRMARTALGLSDTLIDAGCCVTDLFEGDEDNLDDAERGVLRRELARQKGNVTAAARKLDISLATMKRKIRQHGLRRKS